MSSLSLFTKQYQLQKTLRFELQPQGKTEEFIAKNGIIKNDKILSENYKKVKPIIDRLHKKFIEDTLAKVSYDWSKLAQAITAFRKDKSPENREKVTKLQEEARKAITAWFEGKQGSKEFQKTQKEYYKKLFGKELFSELLLAPEMHLTAEEKEQVLSFARFTTYFTGFYENRKNMYTSDAKSTAIAFRLVNDNFPKFMADCEVYQILSQACPQILTAAEKHLHDKGYFTDKKFKDVFTVAAYNDILTQSQIDALNTIIGGISGKEGTEKLQGINEAVNIATQQNKELKETLKSKPHKMMPLFKQILSDRDTLSFVAEQFADDKEALAKVQELKQYLQEHKTLQTCRNLFKSLQEFDLHKIYVSRTELNFVSHTIYGDWNKINDAFTTVYLSNLGREPKKKDFENIKKELKNNDLSLSALTTLTSDLTDRDGKETTFAAYLTDVNTKITAAETVLAKTLPLSMKTAAEKATVKEQLDAIENLIHALKVFNADPENDCDVDFYSTFDDMYAALDLTIPIYNKVRNYATKKPYSTEKFKLNFALPTLANGWDKNKENENGALILLKDGQYYLAVMNCANKPDIAANVTVKKNDVYRKMVYKLFPDFSKMLPKCTTQLNEVKEHFQTAKTPYVLDNDKFLKPLTITKEIFDLNNNLIGDVKKFQIKYLRDTNDNEGYFKALATWIDFAKDFLSKYKSTAGYDFQILLPTNQYEKLDAFYGDLNNIMYKIDYENIPVTTVDQWVEQGQIYLFRIYNKDFATGATGKPNIHTLYWKSVFDPENLKDVVIKLNGEAELFMRPKSDMPAITHAKGSKLVNRKDKNGQPIPDDIYHEIYQYANGKVKTLSTEAKAILPETIIKNATHAITKDKRFLSNKYFFHVPVTLNFKQPKQPKQFNNEVQEFLHHNKDINIIGIDRGERNLIYAVVINQKGEILDKQQITFNVINKYDYQTKLNQRAQERIAAKQAWDTVNKIKDLKEGYLSLVVRQIADMMIKYNAIVVLENLNVGFKRVRGGIAEKAVYQKFEKMLIDKLNYLVFKDEKAHNPGGILNGYQLTDKFDSFEKMGSQCGFLFYVPAAYTSKIDPVTGFANVLSLKGITNREAKKEFISKFDSLKYDTKKDNFILTCNLDKFKVSAESHVKKWDLVIFGKRIVYDAQARAYVDKYPCADLKAILEENTIDYKGETNILPSVTAVEADKAHTKFFDTIYRAIADTLQMRNSNNATGEDYILSPVADKKGNFFDSRKHSENLPKDADANGAYHIALKGLYLLKQINLAEPGKKVNLSIKNADWFKFTQTRH